MVLEEIQGVKYIQSLSEIEGNLPFILISNTHTNPNDIADNIISNTKLLIHPNSGHDNLNYDFFKKANFPIVLGNPIRSNAVVEYTLSCVMNEFAPIPHHHHWSTLRTWDRKLLRDQKVTILGYGHIGKLLHSTLSCLCHEVNVYDPYVESSDVVNILSNSMLKDTNILIIAASLNDKNKNLVDNSILSHVSSDCLIINPARGELVNEEQLVQYLQKHPKSKAYLDVFQQEPFTPGHLNEIKNANKTSHIAGVYEKLNKDIISFEYLIIKDFMEHFDNLSTIDFINEYQDCILNEGAFRK